MKFTGLIRKLIVGAALAIAPAASFAGVFISVGFAPPALPVYTQPICPGDGYLWNPGYWAYGDDGYYWVPGVWVQPPSVGLLWTPGYWGWGGSAFIFHEGYWGPHVGFYGGINYGFGFGGSGFYGGEWRGGHFAYNTAYSNVNAAVIHNTYINRATINNTNISNSHTSFNGGAGGIQARPTSQEANYEHENHIPPTSVQQSHIQAAHSNPANFAKTNGGHPAMAAIQRPGATNTAVAARGATPASNRLGNPSPNNARPAGQQVNQRQNTTAEQRPAISNAQQTRTNGFGQTAQRPAQSQMQSRPQMQQQQVRPQQQAARPQTPAARPETQQARPQPQPRAQAAPKAENHGGEHGHR